MSLKEKINSDLKVALLDGDKTTASTLRGLKATILNEEVAQGKRDEGLDDQVIEKLIAREVKKRHESVELYTKAGRQELADAEQFEATVLEKYLPEQVSDQEIKKLIDEIIVQLGASSPADMGKVIGATKAKLGNTADGATIAKLAKEALS